MDFAEELLYLADEGDLQRADDSCGVLYGIIRDAAYKMKQAAENERRNHILHGTWDGEEPNSANDSHDQTPGGKPVTFVGDNKPVSSPDGNIQPR